VGILGNKNSQKKRKEALIESGFSEAEIEKIYGPIGLDIGARTPSEIALSIMAEIICLNRSVSVGAVHKSHSHLPEATSINNG
jgi:xanthine dehydrogenase accessory factor